MGLQFVHVADLGHHTRVATRYTHWVPTLSHAHTNTRKHHDTQERRHIYLIPTSPLPVSLSVLRAALVSSTACTVHVIVASFSASSAARGLRIARSAAMSDTMFNFCTCANQPMMHMQFRPSRFFSDRSFWILRSWLRWLQKLAQKVGKESTTTRHGRVMSVTQ